MDRTEFKRIKVKEITFSRAYQAGLRRIRDMPHALSWTLNSDLASRSKLLLERYYDKHKGERCVIIGNGPSLKKMDLSLIENEYTFGMNRIYLIFDQIDFRPTYFVSVNELVLSQFSNEIADLKMPKFLNWNQRRNYDRDDESILYIKTRFGLSDDFGVDITKPLYSGGTVTFIALQLAYYMGFSEVILIGIDHSFNTRGTPNKVELRKSDVDDDHFHPQYFPAGSKWQLPDLVRSEIAYSKARDAFESNGRRIIDATEEGLCRVFPKESYRSIFR